VEVDEQRLKMRCSHVQRHLRLALSDWYAFLSRRSLDSDSWAYDVDWWMKNVPNMLDIPWAHKDLYDYVRRPGMLGVFLRQVDEVCLSMDRTDDQEDFPSSVFQLRDSLNDLSRELEDEELAV
jgi:hypothetical protein|tara:strand:- start:768 stop:1136 length:369 start_codon:yes stop_codon:yes gene_type:complete